VLVNGSRAHLPQARPLWAALLPVCLQVSPDVLRRLQSRGANRP
jgi:ribose 1,5-bisphosphokinase PhnN